VACPAKFSFENMKNQISKKNTPKINAAFTMAELLIVITIVTVLTMLTLPLGVDFYRKQNLDEVTGDILGALRRAQNQAVFQLNDSAFGVEFLSGSYVIFQGSSYAGRTQSEDEAFTISGGVTTSGITEVVFAKHTGIPDTTGTLTLTSGSDTKTVNINAYGKIERS
jgi:Tfp pilus assembly protein FimT